MMIQIFFPVVTKQLNFLISFNLRTAEIEIIDHSKLVVQLHMKYGSASNCIVSNMYKNKVITFNDIFENNKLNI